MPVTAHPLATGVHERSRRTAPGAQPVGIARTDRPLRRGPCRLDASRRRRQAAKGPDRRQRQLVRLIPLSLSLSFLRPLFVSVSAVFSSLARARAGGFFWVFGGCAV